MAQINDLTLAHRLFVKAYRFRSCDWATGASFRTDLRQAKVALITTAALHQFGEPTFDEQLRGGDCSFRELPTDVDVQKLRIAHRSSAFDQTGALQDRNLVFPLDRFRELVSRGLIGALNHRHFSFMGSITAPGKLIAETAPAVARLLVDDQVDGVFLVPA